MATFRVLGRALQREDGRGKVTGEAHLIADVIRPDMLWGKILRSPLAHARIVNIDASRARNLLGVKATDMLTRGKGMLRTTPCPKRAQDKSKRCENS